MRRKNSNGSKPKNEMTQTKKYCPFCGARIKKRNIEGRNRSVCESCGRTLYENPLPATCAVVFNELGQVLMTKRAVEPAYGEWALAGGFVEIDETPQECVLRELYEETGLRGEIIRQLGVEGEKSEMYVNLMIAGFLIKADSEEPRPGDDVSYAEWFDPDKAPEPVFESHKKLFKIGIEILTVELMRR
ncbi:NUDIX hydrolase [bacterium]|nr:MAG: NUDIX hydrolase [bacterium]